MKTIGFKTTKIDVYRKSQGKWQLGPQKGKQWVSINEGYIYVALPTYRAYWIISKMKIKAKFNDKTRTMSIRSYKIRFHSPKEYEKAKMVNNY
jgi:hypothetical protein